MLVAAGSIIYIYDISSTRVFGTTLDNLNFVLKLHLKPRDVVLCTTKRSTEEHRTKQVESGYWKEGIYKASTAHKFENSGPEKRSIYLDHIISLLDH